MATLWVLRYVNKLLLFRVLLLGIRNRTLMYPCHIDINFGK